ncbi:MULTISPECIES: hypothetical protein [unclassified Sinorhizobium]|uniref:hypothetical protein n=1 Tax=unclassified Sinorhizobium TaxID=2613772 RepID=UPI0024C3773A|nr:MULTISPECIES: hypothetical protein [unclassified Sinorhizobium]MDK1373686.1 hypothetical protein [Sinorhizobium sp. 6-70]MDK1477752.1 hypothetical protein [Sinorhizobium sp. 6-117]
MKMRKLHRKALSVVIACLAVLAADDLIPMQFGSFVSEAQAIVGRPLTPASVAGVARRTTRRVIRRSSVYVAALPAGCVRTSVSGAVVWRCGGAYYQPYGDRYVVVYID